MIEESTRQKGVTGLWLGGNQFRRGQGAKFALDVLKSNRSIETFSWTRNSFFTTEDACKLIDAVVEHPAIRRLELTRSLNKNTSPYLFSRVGGTGALLNINLLDNKIKTKGGRYISDFLSTNPSLEMLNLGGNRITDDDALHIALALQSNTNLRELNLTNNALTKKGKGLHTFKPFMGSAVHQH